MDFTTRLSLSKPDPDPTTGDFVDVSVLNGNFDTLDSNIGCTVCTSGTRPATPYDGQLIRETDTRRVLVWNATQSVWDAILTQPGAEVRHSTTQTITHDTETKLTWNTIISDNDFSFASGTDFTIPVIGVYLAVATIRWNSNSTGYRRVSIYNQGILIGDQAAPALNGIAHPQTVSAMFLAQASDVVDARCIQTSGGDLVIGTTSMTPHFAIRRIA